MIVTPAMHKAADPTPDFTKDLEKLKAQTDRMREECEGILDRLDLRRLIGRRR